MLTIGVPATGPCLGVPPFPRQLSHVERVSFWSGTARNGHEQAVETLSRVNYMRVVSVSGDRVEVEDPKTGFTWGIGSSILAEQAQSSDQVVEERKVSRTELARILEQDVRDCVFVTHQGARRQVAGGGAGGVHDRGHGHARQTPQGR